MSDIDKTKNLLWSLANSINNHQIDSVYKDNNIDFLRVDLYLDFIFSLNDLIQESYLGDDVSPPHVQKIHFDWVWKRVCDGFTCENVYFHDNQELYEYFKDFFNEVFYYLEESEKDDVKNKKSVERVWRQLFNYKTIKSEAEFKLFLTLYVMFNKTFG